MSSPAKIAPRGSLSWSSARQIAAAEIVDRPQDAFEVAPPDRRREVDCRLPDGCHDLSQRREAIVVVQRAAVVAAHAMRHERPMVMIEQWSLRPMPAVGIPVQGHHVGEVARRRADAPAIPIDQPDVVSAIPRQESVPDVGVAVCDREIAMRVVACEETGRRVEKSLIEIAPLESSRPTLLSRIIRRRLTYDGPVAAPSALRHTPDARPCARSVRLARFARLRCRPDRPSALTATVSFGQRDREIWT